METFSLNKICFWEINLKRSVIFHDNFCLAIFGQKYKKINKTIWLELELSITICAKAHNVTPYSTYYA